MYSYKNYQESKVKSAGKGIFPAWVSSILGFAEWNDGYDKESIDENNTSYKNEIVKSIILQEESNSIYENYSRLDENFDFSDFILKNINDIQIKNDFIKYIRSVLLINWINNAEKNTFYNDFPTTEKPIVDASTWQDLPLFLDNAFIPRLRNSNDELLWILRIKDRYPEKTGINRHRFVIVSLFFYLDIIASLESLVGRDIAKNYGEPNTSDPKYWKLKREINEYYQLQKSPEDILTFFWGKDNPYQNLDLHIERLFQQLK